MRYHRKIASAFPYAGAPEAALNDGMSHEYFERAACRFFREFNGNPPLLSLNDFLVRFERAIIFNTLAEVDGCQRRAAALLKLKNTTLNRKVKVQRIRFVKTPVLPVPD